MKFNDYIVLFEAKINKIYEDSRSKEFLKSLTKEELHDIFIKLNDLELIPENLDPIMLERINKHFNTFEDFTAYIEEIYMKAKSNL